MTYTRPANNAAHSKHVTGKSFLSCKKYCESLTSDNDHRSQLIGSRFFCYNSPAAAAREVFKPSTDAESLLGSIKKKFF